MLKAREIYVWLGSGSKRKFIENLSSIPTFLSRNPWLYILLAVASGVTPSRNPPLTTAVMS